MQPFWNRRRLWTFVMLAGLVGTAVGLQLQRASRNRAARAAVHHWIGTTVWWDRNATESGNERRKLEALRAMGEAAVDVLRQDLKYDPAWMRVLQRFPALERLLGGSGPGDDANEVRHRAIYHLGRLGQPAHAAVPDVAQLASDPDGRIRSEVAYTLGLLRVGSTMAQRTLQALQTDPDGQARFAATIALWNLDRTNRALMEQVSRLITTNNLSWPSICLKHLGPEAADFAPHLREVLLQSEWSMARAQAVQAVWSMEGDPDFVIAQIAALEAQVLQDPGAAQSGNRWTKAEQNVASMTQYFIDQRQFRERLRPMLRRILDNPASHAHRFATVYLQKFDQLDRRDAKSGGDTVPQGAPTPSPPP